MKTLQDFTLPGDGEMTVCVINGKINSMNYEFANVNAFTSVIERYPKIHITADTLHHFSTKEEVQDLFLRVNVSFLKQFSQVYHEQGFKEVLNLASKNENTVVSLLARFVLKCYNYKEKITTSDPLLTSYKVINEYSQTKNWSNSLIRYISWNIYATKLAVAALDDTVRIFSSDTAVVPLLKCTQQKNITCLEWRPSCVSEIAVGCENFILIWSIDPSSLIVRPSTSNAILLHKIQHKPVISLSWSPRGDSLASVAINDPNILIWNVELGDTSAIKRSGNSGNMLVKWSPTGDRLFIASNKIVFRVWDCFMWNAERWSVMSGRIQGACWLSCGTVLIFAINEEPMIYGLTFTKSDVMFASEIHDSSNTAIPLFDLTKVDIDGVLVGGIVQTMDTDIHGRYLAIVFQDTNCVAIFDVHKTPVLQILSNSLVVGLPEEKPTTLAFQKNFSQGACLSIGWSSGRLQQYPIIENKATFIDHTTYLDQNTISSFTSHDISHNF